MSKYAWEIIRDENGLIENVLLDGKEAKRSFMRGMRKAQKTSYWHEFVIWGHVQNKFSKVEVYLDPLERSIATWCINWYFNDYSKNMTKTEAPVHAYDDMKYFLLTLNRSAYYELID